MNLTPYSNIFIFMGILFRNRSLGIIYHALNLARFSYWGIIEKFDVKNFMQHANKRLSKEHFKDIHEYST